MKNSLGVVYSITNIKTNKIYIGQTINFKRRKSEHIYNLKNNKHRNHYLQEDFNIFGEASFIFKIEAENLNRDQRLEIETKLIQFHGGIESFQVYNFQDNINENIEMKNLVSKNQKGKVIKTSSIEKMREKLKGRTLSDSHKQNIRKSCKRFIGDINPAKRPEVRKKISEAVSGKNNGFYGKHHSQEAKDKIRQSRLGKSPANKGINLSDATKNKISRGVRLSKVKNGLIDVNLLKCLYEEYKELGSYKAVAKLHPQYEYRKIRSLILKCNDYLEIE